MKYHPDRNNSGDASEQFKAVNEAYEVLSDQERRAMYDRFGHEGPQSAFGRGSGGGGVGGGGGVCGGGGGGSKAGRGGPRGGGDVREDMRVRFEEAAFGTEKTIGVEGPEPCSNCHGQRSEPGSEPKRCTNCEGTGELRRVQQSVFGQFVNVSMCDRCQGEGAVVSKPCKTCRGHGYEQRTRNLQVKIPAGIDDGAQMRLSGEGELGERGGPRGNLYLQVSVKAHKHFQRDGDDLIYNLEINFGQAALGDETEIPTLEKPLPLRIPSGTQSGQVFVLKGHGVPHLRSGGRGDLLVHTHVVTPKNLSDEQKQLLAQLSESMGTPLSPEDKSLLNKIKDALG